ncbi:hypothetical protein KQX54_004052 [Cotesia glomerata]|uniref:Uncharacterized protein n=1 Tax=Cotesia glomerata TaxID=32391 RepID=A0AAV7I6R5_COTGL|nr:hypothetical protein KQX54_004052 [Cotesia glomerata]
MVERRIRMRSTETKKMSSEKEKRRRMSVLVLRCRGLQTWMLSLSFVIVLLATLPQGYTALDATSADSEYHAQNVEWESGYKNFILYINSIRIFWRIVKDITIRGIKDTLIISLALR